LSFGFNVCRTTILNWIAAKKGPAAIAEYHDQTGVSILIACTMAMWLVALLMRSRRGVEQPAAAAPASPPETIITSSAGGAWARIHRVGFALIAWLLAVEAGVFVWSRSGAAEAEKAARWSIAWPQGNESFKEIKANEEAWKLLQYDSAQQAQWVEADGTAWSAYYFNWQPGRVGAYLAANRHSPEICMTYAGWEMRSGPERAVFEVNKVHLPFRCYSFVQGTRTLYIFHCRWEPGFETNPALLQEQGTGTTYRGLRGLSVLWSTRGRAGQKILEMIVQGCDSKEAAKAALREQLEKLIRTDAKTESGKQKAERLRDEIRDPRSVNS